MLKGEEINCYRAYHELELKVKTALHRGLFEKFSCIDRISDISQFQEKVPMQGPQAESQK